MGGLDSRLSAGVVSPRDMARVRATLVAEDAEKALAQEDFRRAVEAAGQAIALAAEENATDARRAELHRLHAAALIGAGYHGRGRAEARTSAEFARRCADIVAEARALHQEAVACFQLGDYSAGLGVARTGLLLLQDTPENDDIGNLQLILGSILLQQGEGNEALNLFHDGLASFRRSRNEWGMARANGHLAVVYKNLGRLDQSIQLSAQAEDVAERLGRSAAGFALNQGIARYWKGDHEGAQTCLLRSLSISHKHGDTLRYTRALIALGRLLADRGETGEARRLFERAERLAEEKRYRRETVLAQQGLGDIAFGAGELAEAGTRWKKAETLAMRIAPGGDLRSAIWTRECRLALAAGDHDGARDMGTRALEAAVATGVAHDRALALIARAEAAHALACRDEAHQGFLEGLGVLRTSGVRFELARALRAVGRALVGEGRGGWREEGFRLLDEAAETCAVLAESDRMAETLLDIVALRLEGGENDLAQAALRKIRLDMAGENSRLVDPLASRLAELEQDLSRRMGESAASRDNPFHRLERSGHLLGRLHDSAEPEGELLRSFLESTASDRGLLALAPALGAGPIRVVARHGMQQREAEGIARKLWLSLPGSPSLAGMPGISVSPGWDSRFTGSPLELRDDIGSSLWVHIPREERECALLYTDRLEQEGFRPYVQMDLSLATSLTHLLSLTLDNLELRRVLRDPARRQGIITQDPKLLQVLESAARVGGDRDMILLQGETGTGKNLFARMIHQASDRRDRRFGVVRCTDMTDSLIEAELFGHRRGAFTDARQSHEGLLAESHGGTVFIDEIDKASLKLQKSLLGVLDDHEFKPVGGSYRRLEARIICASAKDLRAEVKAGRFLEELYYRLKKFSFTLPPLRERRGDIPLLAEFFLQEARSARKRDDLRLAPEALRLLMNYPWPGNVRDLEHEVGRAATFAEAGGLIGPDTFSDEIQEWRRAMKGRRPLGAADPANGTAATRLTDAVAELEMRLVAESLERNAGAKSRTARELGLTRRGLDLKLARYGLAANGRGAARAIGS